ncbi:hypothetical protein [Paenibacillus sp. Leaf72]|uniref:hypothetical protein n=1 Tax=Paenibacillus sp. Leaf72 TaxID=1736234 RepID=UPI0006F89134|nr:hypothetical protein [Paenibacillus sp. Leaf72]KQO01104.1 hypothetical protein ASF12_14725 [Paenibacillus sp. Leaf72]
MKEVLINDSYYIGFEGEPEIVFMYESLIGRHELRLWNGYFETFLDCLLEQVPVQNVILHEYYIHEGWYDESPWEIQDVEGALQLFKSFAVRELKEDENRASENITAMLPLLSVDIITFLEQANESGSRVFIIYD